LLFAAGFRILSIDMKAAIVILIILSLALGAGLFWRHTTATREKKVDVTEKAELTNELTDVKGKLDDQEKM